MFTLSQYVYELTVSGFVVNPLVFFKAIEEKPYGLVLDDWEWMGIVNRFSWFSLI